MAKKVTKTERRFRDELVSQLLTLSASGFGLVSALAWNEAIQGFVKEYIQSFFPDSVLWSRFLYAILITFLAVMITYQLSRLSSHFQSRGN